MLQPEKLKVYKTASSELENNDYFAFVELEEYACYVVADGLNDLSDARSARIAIETVLLAFQEHKKIVEEGADYVAQKYVWETAGYFWKAANANNIVDELGSENIEG